MSKPVIAITDHIFPSEEIERIAAKRLGAELIIGNCKNEEEVQELVREADAILTTFAPVTAKVVSSLTRCKVIARYGVGVDNVAVDEATRKNIYVCNVPDYCMDEVAEHVLAMIFTLARSISELDRDVKAGNWDYRPFRPFFRIKGRTLGLLGFGRIARNLGQKATAIGLNVIAFDPYVTPGKTDDNVKIVSFEQLLEESDFLSVHCPLTADTKGLIGREALQKMKPQAILINAARGGIVDEEALVEALDNRQIGGAGLDVLSKEPIPIDHPLLKYKNVILTPHVGFYSEESTLELQKRAVDEVIRALSGQVQRSPVNKLDRVSKK
jgi:D-3-phosphoglycerate dehydrogenase